MDLEVELGLVEVKAEVKVDVESSCFFFRFFFVMSDDDEVCGGVSDVDVMKEGVSFGD